MRIVWRGQKQYAGDVALDPNVPKDVPDSIASRILADYGKHGLVEVVVEAPEAEVKARDVSAPPNDRMVRKPRSKRGGKTR